MVRLKLAVLFVFAITVAAVWIDSLTLPPYLQRRAPIYPEAGAKLRATIEVDYVGGDRGFLDRFDVYRERATGHLWILGPNGSIAQCPPDQATEVMSETLFVPRHDLSDER